MQEKNLKFSYKNYLLDVLLVVILFSIAFFVYSYKIDVVTPGIQGDEITIARAGEYVLSLPEIVPFVDINYGHPTPLLYFEGTSIKLFGKTLFAIRLSSIFFGALSVVAFYVLLRSFFNKTVSIVTSVMMLFSYPLVVVSRLAYEITPSLFFQIMTIVFLHLAWKTKKLKFYAAVGLSLGAGLYTYVGFRTFALIIIFITVFIQFKLWKRGEKFVKRSAGIFLLSFFVITAPLFAYSLGHASVISARAKSLSPFHQGLPAMEVFKELQGATFRLANLFLPNSNTDHNPNGDPNLKQNPSRVPMFDIVTFLLFINGLIFMITKNKKLFLVTAVLSISPLINDIFSLERIPEGHYYGIGHPNTLRIAGVIPIIYFIIAFGLFKMKAFFDEQAKGFYTTMLVVVGGIVASLNWYVYFNQPFNEYVYFYNGARMLRVAEFLNKTSTKEVYISPTFIADERVKYFTSKDVAMIPYKPKTVEQMLSDTNSLELIIFAPDFNEKLGRAFWEKIKSQPEIFHGEILASPDNKIDAIIFNNVNNGSILEK
jgi:4-amino-4-deoxy-L-arabinose transferase-like glycosyltransferase